MGGNGETPVEFLRRLEMRSPLVGVAGLVFGSSLLRFNGREGEGVVVVVGEVAESETLSFD
jgi:hypothetical protein